MTFSLKVTGQEALLRGLSALGNKRATDELVGNANEAAAEDILPDVKNNTPVRTGALRDANEVERDGNRVIIVNDQEYAAAVEADVGFLHSTVRKPSIQRKIRRAFKRSWDGSLTKAFR